jgi:hypothetical protein
VISPESLAPAVRIGLRYLVGFLIAKGWAVDPAAASDAGLVQAVCYLGAGASFFISEGWYWLAKRRGWTV